MATGQVWLGQPSVKGPESLRMALLAFSHIGSQYVARKSLMTSA